jgi:hypothetical protein
MLEGAAAVWSAAPFNVAFDRSLGDKAAVDETFAKADKAVSIAVDNNRLITNIRRGRSRPSCAAVALIPLIRLSNSLI